MQCMKTYLWQTKYFLATIKENHYEIFLFTYRILISRFWSSFSGFKVRMSNILSWTLVCRSRWWLQRKSAAYITHAVSQDIWHSILSLRWSMRPEFIIILTKFNWTQQKAKHRFTDFFNFFLFTKRSIFGLLSSWKNHYAHAHIFFFTSSQQKDRLRNHRFAKIFGVLWPLHFYFLLPITYSMASYTSFFSRYLENENYNDVIGTYPILTK